MWVDGQERIATDGQWALDIFVAHEFVTGAKHHHMFAQEHPPRSASGEDIQVRLRETRLRHPALPHGAHNAVIMDCATLPEMDDTRLRVVLRPRLPLAEDGATQFLGLATQSKDRGQATQPEHRAIMQNRRGNRGVGHVGTNAKPIHLRRLHPDRVRRSSSSPCSRA